MQDSYGLRREERLRWVALGDRPSTLCTQDGLAPAGAWPSTPLVTTLPEALQHQHRGSGREKHNPSTAQMPPVTRAPDITLTY